jgi:hypothetical protein
LCLGASLLVGVCHPFESLCGECSAQKHQIFTPTLRAINGAGIFPGFQILAEFSRPFWPTCIIRQNLHTKNATIDTHRQGDVNEVIAAPSTNANRCRRPYQKLLEAPH